MRQHSLPVSRHSIGSLSAARATATHRSINRSLPRIATAVAGHLATRLPGRRKCCLCRPWSKGVVDVLATAVRGASVLLSLITSRKPRNSHNLLIVMPSLLAGGRRSLRKIIASTQKPHLVAKTNMAESWNGEMSQEDFMYKDECIVLDDQDNVIGHENKYNTHRFNAQQPKGILHRAFSVFLFNDAGELLLQQRAADKITFPNVWTNTCCSHPLHGYTPTEVDGPADVADASVMGVKVKTRRDLGTSVYFVRTRDTPSRQNTINSPLCAVTTNEITKIACRCPQAQAGARHRAGGRPTGGLQIPHTSPLLGGRRCDSRL